MKKSDIELAIDTLNDLKKVSDRLPYNSSSDINKRVMTIMPILEAEFNRLSEDKVELNAPKILILGTKEANDNKLTLTELTNNVLSDLVDKKYKIIDYGINTVNNEMYVYIKYTS